MQQAPWLFVWDFDETITREHATNNAPGQSAYRMLQNMVDPNLFKNLCTRLHESGHFVKIASYADGLGPLQVVFDYLAVVFGPNSQRSFLHDESVEGFMPIRHGQQKEGKNVHIRNLLRQISFKVVQVQYITPMFQSPNDE
jgi:hypothetical protein